MRVSIDGVRARAREGQTLEEVASRLGVRLSGIAVVKKPVELEKIATDLFEILTNRGRMILRFECQQARDGWMRAYKRLEGAGVRWTTRDAVAIGPVVTDFEPSRDAVEMKPYDATLSLSGFSSENTHLILSRKLHSGAYAPPRGCGVLGRIVYGRHLVDALGMGDCITKVSPIVETKEAERALVRADGAYILREPVEIFTKLVIRLDKLSPSCGEHLYNAVGEGHLTVSRKTSRFVAYDGLSVLSLAKEKVGGRSRGSVTVRNSGSQSGSVYVYLREAPLATSHTLVGDVVCGMELMDVAAEGDTVAVELLPERLQLLGRTQAEAGRLLQAHGIKHARTGDQSDRALVVESEPATTLEAYGRGEVSCLGVDPSSIVKVRLYEDSNSVRYFRRVTGLELRRIGKLRVYFATPRMELVLFKGDDTLGSGLMPENIPVGSVAAGAIGVTNTAKKFAGMLGIRLVASDRFGPTAESFEGTNLVGEVVGNAEALKGLREGQYIYLEAVP